MKYLILISVFLANSALAQDLSVLKHMKSNLANMKKAMDEHKTPEDQQKNMMITGLMTVSYHTKNINESCEKLLIKQCGKTDTDGRIQCLADNRDIIYNKRCLSNLGNVFGPVESKKEIIVGDFKVPAGSKIQYSNDGGVRSAILSQNVKYKYFDLKKDSSISFSSKKDIQHYSAFPIVAAVISGIIEINGIKYKFDDSRPSQFNQDGSPKIAKLAENTMIKDILVPADSIVSWSYARHKGAYISEIKFSRDLIFHGFKIYAKDSISFNNNSINYNIKRNVGKNKTYTYKGIKYVNFINLDNQGNVKSSVFAEDTVINNVKYPAYSLFTIDNLGNIKIKEQLDVPITSLKKGDVHYSKSYLFRYVEGNGKYKFPTKYYNSMPISQVFDLNLILRIHGLNREDIKIVEVLKPNTKFTVYDVISNVNYGASSVAEVILKDDNGNLYLFDAHDNRIFSSVFKCVRECTSIAETFNYCMKKKYSNSCSVKINTPKPSQLDYVINYLNKNNISYKKQATTSVTTYVTVNQLAEFIISIDSYNIKSIYYQN